MFVNLISIALFDIDKVDQYSTLNIELSILCDVHLAPHAKVELPPQRPLIYIYDASRGGRADLSLELASLPLSKFLLRSSTAKIQLIQRTRRGKLRPLLLLETLAFANHPK